MNSEATALENLEEMFPMDKSQNKNNMRAVIQKSNTNMITVKDGWSLCFWSRNQEAASLIMENELPTEWK